MDKHDSTTTYTETLKQLTLSETSRARLAENLSNYADFHAVQEVGQSPVASGQGPVREGGDNRSIEQGFQIAVWDTAFFTRLHLSSMSLFTIVAFLLIGGGASLFAQQSLPGDLLYPVKVGVNENLLLAFANSPESETKMQLALLEERVREVETLKSLGRWQGTLASTAQSNVKSQAVAVNRAREKSEAVVAVAAKSDLETVMSRFNALIGKDDRLTVATLVDAGAQFASRDSVSFGGRSVASAEPSIALTAPTPAFGKAEADMGVSTMLADGPAPLSVLYLNAQVHLDAVSDVINRYQAEIPTQQYEAFTATLNESRDLIKRSTATEPEARTRELIEEATMRIGEVEAALTLLGEATVDIETGAILDIDFSRQSGVDDSAYIDPGMIPMPPEVLELESQPELEGRLQISI